MWPFAKKEPGNPALLEDLAELGKDAPAAVRFVLSGKDAAVLSRLGNHPDIHRGGNRREYLVDETQPAVMWRLGQLFAACGVLVSSDWEPGLEPLEAYLKSLSGIGKIRARVVVWMLESGGFKPEALVRSYLKMLGTPTGELLEEIVAFQELVLEHPKVFLQFFEKPRADFLRHLKALGYSPEPWQDELFLLLGNGVNSTSNEVYSWLERLGPHFEPVMQRNLGHLTRPQRLAAVVFVKKFYGPAKAAEYLQRYANEPGMPEAILELKKEDARSRLT